MPRELADRAYDRCLAQLQAAASARERAAAVAHTADALGVSRQTVYRQLQARGYTSGRAKRQDKGESRVAPETRVAISQMMAAARNKRGRCNLPLSEARRIALEQGLVDEPVSAGHLGRLLRRDGLDRRRMTAPEPAIARCSTYPNHVWVFDISVAIQWYFRDPETGKRLELYPDAGARFYEGKRENFARSKSVLHRYMLVDHRSGAYFCRYYYTPGESAVDVVDFLYRAMAEKGVGPAYPFRGIPHRLLMDQGPANKSGLTLSLLESLGVDVELHMPGNAKASGAVETRHNHWQESFEGRLIQGGASDLDDLNRQALLSCADFCSDPERAHSRHGLAPMDLWAAEVGGHLVEAPDQQQFLALASSKRRTGTLTNQLRLRADGRTWEITGEHVYPGQKVAYRMCPYIEQGVRVWDDCDRELTVTELAFDAAGFPLNGHRHVWDDEAAAGSAFPATPAAAIAKQATRKELEPVVADVFSGLEDRLSRRAYLVRRGQDWSPADVAAAAEPLLSSVAVRERVAAELGRALSRDEARWWKVRAEHGLAESAYADALAEFTAAPAASTVAGVAGVAT